MFGIRVDATTHAATCGVGIIVAPVFVSLAEYVGKKAPGISELINVQIRKLAEVKFIDSVFGGHLLFPRTQRKNNQLESDVIY